MSRNTPVIKKEAVSFFLSSVRQSLNLSSSKINSSLSLFICVLLLFTSQLFPQKQLKVETESGIKYISSYERQGTIYFSAEEFAHALSVPVYYNKDAGKLELKFNANTLVVTAKNPFLVINLKKDNKRVSYQLPTSTYTVNQKIYVPLIYSLNAFKRAYGEDISFTPPDKIIVKGKIEQIDSPKTGPVKFDITGITIDQKANGTLLRVKSKKRILSYNSTFKDGKLTFVFRKAVVDTASVNKKINKGMIKSIASRNVKGDTEINIYLTRDYSASEVLNAETGNDILITLHNKAFAYTGDVKKDKWNFDVIVIDPGHGGHDAGAIGVNGVKEKDINLAIGLKLGALIQQNVRDVKVVYTRSDDKFVELYKRGKIANDNNGKLFISIHCNSSPQKPGDANGFEIYLLRPGRTKEAISIAERENSVIEYEDNPARYQKLTDENFILVSMAHSSYMKYSEKFSELLEKQFSANLSMQSRGIKQAGFYVLVGASMPSVLIEAGFLSNKDDAAYLKSAKGQEEIAGAIYQGLKKFKGFYEAALQEK